MSNAAADDDNTDDNDDDHDDDDNVDIDVVLTGRCRADRTVANPHSRREACRACAAAPAEPKAALKRGMMGDAVELAGRVR